MTPADELRTAAARLAGLATAASIDLDSRDTSTWTSHIVGARDGRLYGPDRVRILHGGSSGALGRGVSPHLHPQHADYIAAMDPIVGLALAAWLASFDGIDISEHGPMSDDVQHALAIARLINQEQP